MERIDGTACREVLQRANVCFTAFFERFSGALQAEPDEELRALLHLHEALESVGNLLDGRLQTATGIEVHEALDCYRRNLVRLHHQLAIMEESAIARRERLNYRQTHLSGARAWCIASRAIT